MYLFYGCRKSTEDFLYADEWPKYQQELKGKFIMHTAFSREMKKDDGSESKQTSLPVNAQTDNGAFL
jgi:NADPH-ferrihemoprotein reductase